MTTDEQGNALLGADEASAAIYGRAVEAFAFYRGDPIGLLDQAIGAAPAFVSARLAKAWMFALATEPAACAMAKTMLADAIALPTNDREQSLAAALAALLAGDWNRSASMLDRHSAEWPRDIVALQSGHLADFFRANARDMRDRIARALPHWPNDMPLRSSLLGMYAFGLEESGDYARAEEAGRTAIALDARDSWAHHAVAHVMEMQGRSQDGIGWMQTRKAHWAGEGSYFKVHNWWHLALCHIDLMEFDTALALHDGPVREGEPGLAVSLVDSASLLWRLQLAGCDVSGRWEAVADAWEAHADGELYPFNDFHAAMAWLGAGRIAKVESLMERWRRGVGGGEAGEWARRTALPLVEGLLAYAKGDYRACADTLFGARQIVNCFGGSHAQRDVIDLTLQEAAIRGGMAGLAEALAHERLAMKPHSPVNRDYLRRAMAAGTA